MRMGGVCQTSLCGAGGGARLPVALHAPGGDLEQPTRQDGRAWGDF